jgi:hypothetical protein
VGLIPYPSKLSACIDATCTQKNRAELGGKEDQSQSVYRPNVKEK